MTSVVMPMEIGGDGHYRLPGGDSRLWVKFSKKSRRVGHKSEMAGRPIYEDVDYITIQQPGERDQLVRPVNDGDKERFRKQWDAYLAESEQTPEGTPVSLLFPNEPTVVDMLRDLKVYTVEQLSQLSEYAIDRLGIDGRRYVSKAKATLDQSANVAQINKLERQVEDMKEQLRQAQEANKAFSAQLREMMAERDRRRAEPEEAEDAPPYRAPPKQRTRGPHRDDALQPPPPERRPELVSE